MTVRNSQAIDVQSKQSDGESFSHRIDREFSTTCCVVGGGPAGMMLGYLLARSGVPVTVIEKHKDFFRDFRGDTVHPSTLELMFELGMLEGLLKLPHQRLTSITGSFGDFTFQALNFQRVPTLCKFVALMPQWDFLNFLSEQAKHFPVFDLRMEHEAIGLIEETETIRGVRVRTPKEMIEIRSDLVVACDGRRSTIRKAANLKLLEIGVPIDVLWFRLPRNSNDPEQLLGRLNYGGALVLINRGDYLQTGFIIRKGSFEEIKRDGLPAFRATLRRIAPYLGDRVDELKEWDEIKLLSVQINRLQRWYRPGLLCIGDAAHAMSPAGGVGINLAIQDAVASANVLTQALKGEAVSELLLARIQKRREFPARVIQFAQANAHRAMAHVFQQKGPVKAPWPLKIAVHVPGLRFAFARVIGVGIRPEHIRGARNSSSGRRLINRVAVCAGVVAAIAIVVVRKRRCGERYAESRT